MRRRWLVLGTVALAACSLVPQTPYLQRRDWPLEVTRPSTTAPKARGGILLVRSVQASPGLDSRGLQWLQPDGSLHNDFYEQWAVPPPQAVEDQLRQWLADSSVFKAVVAPGSRLVADFVLEGELTGFAADLKAGVARAELAVVLLDQRRGSPRVLLQRTETATVPLAGDQPPDIVAALKAALADLLRRTEADVAKAGR